jgi:hypothetical protein
MNGNWIEIKRFDKGKQPGDDASIEATKIKTKSIWFFD